MNDCFEGMFEEDLTEEDHNSIDNEIFRCDQCDWWFEDSDHYYNDNEEYYEDICTDCGESNNN